MKKEIEQINLIIETRKLTSKKRKIKKGWKFKTDDDGTFHLWYEEPVSVLPDELFEI